MNLSRNDIENLIEQKSDKIKYIKNKGRSEVWNKFSQIQVDNKLCNFVICVNSNCNEIYSFKNNSTTCLLRHKCKEKNEKIENYFSKKTSNEVISEIKKELTSKLVDFCSNDIKPFCC